MYFFKIGCTAEWLGARYECNNPSVVQRIKILDFQAATTDM